MITIEHNQSFMKERPVLPLLLSMSLPVVLSMLIQSLYNIVDSIWVAKLGTDALTAVSLAFPLQNIILAVGVGMGIGVASVISMELGAKNQEVANRTATLGVALVVIHCIVFILLGIFITKPFLAMFTKDAGIFELSCDYTSIVLCFSFGQLMQMCIEKIFQGTGHTKTTMYLLISGCIVNIILDPILIFGWFGFPAMGVSGAAWATVIGQIFALLLYILVLCKKKIGVSIHPRYFSFDSKLIRRIYSISIPSSLMIAMPSVLVAILNGILSPFGTVYVAVFGLYFKLQSFVNLPAAGVIQGMRPIIGYNYGAEEYTRVRETIRYSLYIVAAIMLVGTTLSLGFPHQILRAFDADPELMLYGVPALRIICLGFLPSTIGIVFSGVFEATGRGRESLTISFLRQFIIIIPLGWLLSLFVGPVGIWVTFPIAESVACIFSIYSMRKSNLIP